MTTHEQDHSAGESPSTQMPPYDLEGATIGRGERAASLVLGGTLVASGLRRRSLVGAASVATGGWLLYRGVSGNGRPAQTLASAVEMGRERDEAGAPPDATVVERSITIGKPADELQELWRDPEHLTRLVGPVAEVDAASGGVDRHQWTVRGPLERNVTWETRLVEDQPGEVLRWESLEDAAVPMEGTVRFRPAPGDRGTEVTLRVRFDPPGGALGTTVMTYLDIVPETLVSEALRRSKRLAETGEIPTLEHNPSARGSGDLL